MDAVPDIAKILGSLLLGGGFVGFLVKFSFTRYITQNDIKHKEAERDLERKTEKIEDTLKNITDLRHSDKEDLNTSFHSIKNSLAKIEMSIEVNKTMFDAFRVIETTVKTDHDDLVVIKAQAEKVTKDINYLFEKSRASEDRGHSCSDKHEDMIKQVEKNTMLIQALRESLSVRGV